MRQSSLPRSGSTNVNSSEAIPPYDPGLLGPVAARVQIAGIDLIQTQFSRADSGHVPDSALGDRKPDTFGIDVSWQVDPTGRALSCLLSFGTVFNTQPAPYEIRATFRLLYDVQPGDPLSQEQLRNFAYWNATFNAWPYWREYLSSTLNRAHLPRFVVPVMGVPR
jgi:hypothetical protein